MLSESKKLHKKQYYLSFRKNLIERGLCVACGKDKNGLGNTKCVSCIQIDRKRRIDKINNGICIRCGNKSIIGKLSCETCAANYRRDRNEKRIKNKSMGLCETCSNPHIAGDRFCEKCKERLPIYIKTRRNKIKDKNLCQYCSSQKLPGMHCCQIHLDKLKEERLNIKKSIMKEYGGKCVCCGENNIKFLSIDHIRNDGNKHRKQIGSYGRSGTGMYLWLKKHGFPKDNFQLLCFNCNLGKAHNGGICPHQDPDGPVNKS